MVWPEEPKSHQRKDCTSLQLTAFSVLPPTGCSYSLPSSRLARDLDTSRARAAGPSAGGQLLSRPWPGVSRREEMEGSEALPAAPAAGHSSRASWAAKSQRSATPSLGKGFGSNASVAGCRPGSRTNRQQKLLDNPLLHTHANLHGPCIALLLPLFEASFNNSN